MASSEAQYMSLLCFAAQGLLPKDPRQPVHNLQQAHTSSLEVCPASVPFPHSSPIMYFCCHSMRRPVLRCRALVIGTQIMGPMMHSHLMGKYCLRLARLLVGI